MAGTSRIPPEEMERLLAEYAANRDPALRDRIVEAHLYIAEIIARKFSGRGVDYDDLYQVASLALVRALDRYDPARGVRFTSFVTPNMAGEVKNYFRDRARALRVSRRGAQLAREAERAREALAQSLGRMPRVDELAEAMGVPEEHILEALETAGLTLVSMDATRDEDGTQTLERFLGIDDGGYTDFERRDALDRAMAALTGRQQEILRYRYYENLSQREVAQRVGVSQMTVSREERNALQVLKATLDENDGPTP